MMDKQKEEIPWGAVRITGGRHKDKIMYYDDDEVNSRKEEVAICYLGDMFIANKCYRIQFKHIDEVNTDHLMSRRSYIISQVSWLAGKSITDSKRCDLLSELHFVDSLLAERMFVARTETNFKKRKVFISHSSKDKQYAKWISVDLANKGHNPWLDEWKIRAGESIPKKISEGLDECEFLLLLLSKHAVESRWVENEWHAKYWHEIQTGKISVIPVLLQRCEIPTLLRSKKYANLEVDYHTGLQEILKALQ